MHDLQVLIGSFRDATYKDFKTARLILGLIVHVATVDLPLLWVACFFGLSVSSLGTCFSQILPSFKYHISPTLSSFPSLDLVLHPSFF